MSHYDYHSQLHESGGEEVALVCYSVAEASSMQVHVNIDDEDLMLFIFILQAKSQFKRRSTANNVEIQIPVPADADSPKFKVRRFEFQRLIRWGWRCSGQTPGTTGNTGRS